MLLLPVLTLNILCHHLVRPYLIAQSKASKPPRPKFWQGKRGTMVSTVSTKDLKGKIGKESVIVVGTLAPDLYRRAHIPNALNIPPEQIKELAPQVLPNHDAEIGPLLQKQSLTRQRLCCP